MRARSSSRRPNLESHSVDMDGSPAIFPNKAAIHSVRIERHRDVAFAIHSNHPAFASEFHESSFHHPVRRRIERQPAVFHKRRNIVSHHGPDEKFAMPGGGHGTSRIVRV